jgi:hypothetical protein
MTFVARRSLIALAAVAFAVAPALAEAPKRGVGELAPVAAYVAKSTQKGTIDGKVARALGISPQGTPVQLTAVVTAYMDGSRGAHLVATPQGQLLLFSQGKGNNGSWLLATQAGALVRAVNWVPTSANPAPMDAKASGPLFTETKAFWKAQLGTPVR